MAGKEQTISDDTTTCPLLIKRYKSDPKTSYHRALPTVRAVQAESVSTPQRTTVVFITLAEAFSLTVSNAFAVPRPSDVSTFILGVRCDLMSWRLYSTFRNFPSADEITRWLQVTEWRNKVDREVSRVLRGMSRFR